MGAKRSHPSRLFSTSYGFQVPCHGRGFEPRRPRQILKLLRESGAHAKSRQAKSSPIFPTNIRVTRSRGVGKFLLAPIARGEVPSAGVVLVGNLVDRLHDRLYAHCEERCSAGTEARSFTAGFRQVPHGLGGICHSGRYRRLLPSYEESVIEVDMDETLGRAYEHVEKAFGKP